jgi:hypothetical protein
MTFIPLTEPRLAVPVAAVQRSPSRGGPFIPGMNRAPTTTLASGEMAVG